MFSFSCFHFIFQGKAYFRYVHCVYVDDDDAKWEQNKKDISLNAPDSGSAADFVTTNNLGTVHSTSPFGLWVLIFLNNYCEAYCKMSSGGKHFKFWTVWKQSISALWKEAKCLVCNSYVSVGNKGTTRLKWQTQEQCMDVCFMRSGYLIFWAETQGRELRSMKQHCRSSSIIQVDGLHSCCIQTSNLLL